MLKNILGNKDQNKEVDDKELKKLREQFKQLSQDSNSQNAQQPAQQAKQQNSQAVAQEQQSQSGEQQNQNFVNTDPQRVEENERVTNLIMQQIKELIEIDNNLNVKIKEIETKLKNNMSTTQDIKKVVDKFHQRLEFIEKSMEKFMGLYEVVTNRFNPFVEEEQKQQIENPQLSTNPNIPEVALSESSEGQADNQAQPAQSADTNNLTQNAQTKQEISEGQADNQAQPAQSADTNNLTQNAQTTHETSQDANQQTQSSAQNASESKPPKTEGAKIIEAAGVKGKLDSEPENVLIQNIDALLNSNPLDEKAMEKLKGEVGKNVNTIVVEAIKGHRKATIKEVDTVMQNIHSSLGLNAGTQESPGPSSGQALQTPVDPHGQETERQSQVNQAQQESSGKESQPEQATQQAQESNIQPSESEGKSQPTAQSHQEISALQQEVPADYHFTLPDGTEIKSIAHLRNALVNMDENTFGQHVNEQGNDFGQWLGLVTGNQELAERFAALKNREVMVSELDKL